MRFSLLSTLCWGQERRVRLVKDSFSIYYRPVVPTNISPMGHQSQVITRYLWVAATKIELSSQPPFQKILE